MISTICIEPCETITTEATTTSPANSSPNVGKYLEMKTAFWDKEFLAFRGELMQRLWQARIPWEVQLWQDSQLYHAAGIINLLETMTGQKFPDRGTRHILLAVNSSALLPPAVPSLVSNSLPICMNPMLTVLPDMCSPLASLMPQMQTIPLLQTSVEVHITTDGAKNRFMCESCNRQWTSMKGNIKFITIKSDTFTGYICNELFIHRGFNVFFEIFPQSCKDCLKQNLDFACEPKWYPEEIKKVIKNYFTKICETFYKNLSWPYTLDSTRRAGQPGTPHDHTACRACRLGVCGSYRSMNEQEIQYTVAPIFPNFSPAPAPVSAVQQQLFMHY